MGVLSKPPSWPVNPRQLETKACHEGKRFLSERPGREKTSVVVAAEAHYHCFGSVCLIQMQYHINTEVLNPQVSGSRF